MKEAVQGYRSWALAPLLWLQLAAYPSQLPLSTSLWSWGEGGKASKCLVGTWPRRGWMAIMRMMAMVGVLIEQRADSHSLKSLRALLQQL